MERLTKRNGKYVEYSDENYSDSVDNYTMLDNCLRKLAEYEDAEEQGMLLPLPCKCGDVLWGIKVYKGYLMAQQGIVREMFFTKKMELIIVVERICRGEFGKKIFRTKAETEQAILDLGYTRCESNPNLFKLQK